MGISEAFYIPAALALIADFHRGPTRSRAVGLHQTGIYIGLILGGFAGHVADAPEFRLALGLQRGGRRRDRLCGAAVVWLRNPHARRVGASRVVPARRRSGELLGNRNFLLLVLYFTLPAIAGWVIKDWMPDILKEQFKLSQGKAGVIAMLYVQIATIAGAVLGGALADWWMRRNTAGASTSARSA